MGTASLTRALAATVWVLAAGVGLATTAAQPPPQPQPGGVPAVPPFFATPDRLDALALVRHAGAWHVAFEEASRIPRAFVLAPITERGIGAEVAPRSAPMAGRVLDVLPPADTGPAWIVLSHPGSAPRITAARIGGTAPEVELVALPGREIDAQLISSAWRMGATQPEGAAVWQGVTYAPPPRARPGRLPSPSEMMEIPERRTRERWLALAVGARTRRLERLPRVVTSEMSHEERAAIALAAGGGAVLWRSPLQWTKVRSNWFGARLTRLDARGRDRERRDDLVPDRDVAPPRVLVDAAGTTWAATHSHQLGRAPSGGVDRTVLTVISVPPERRSGIRVYRPNVEGRASAAHVGLVECGGAVWVLASVYDSSEERWIAFPAANAGTPIELLRRPADRRGEVRPGVTSVDLACDGDQAAALLMTGRQRPARDRDPWPPGHVALLTWNARPPPPPEQLRQ